MGKGRKEGLMDGRGAEEHFKETTKKKPKKGKKRKL